MSKRVFQQIRKKIQEGRIEDLSLEEMRNKLKEAAVKYKQYKKEAKSLQMVWLEKRAEEAAAIAAAAKKKGPTEAELEAMLEH